MAEAFAATIAKDPQKYTLDEHDSEMLTRAVKAFSEALLQVRPSFKRNTPTVRGKDDARKRAEEIVRRLGRIIRASDQISDPDKLAVRIRPRDPRPTRRTVPLSPPHLHYMGAINEGGESAAGLHVIRFAEAPDIKGRKKPHGAVRIELFQDLVPDGQPIPRYPGEFLGGRPWYLRSFTSSPIRIAPRVPPVPMLVVYWARWADAKGNVGPFSATLRTRVEGWGGIAADKLLGPMPQVKVLEKDPKYIAMITHLRQIEQVTVERMLPDAAPAADEAGQGEVRCAPRELEGPATSLARTPVPTTSLPTADAA
jgi:hypothetical protein